MALPADDLGWEHYGEPPSISAPWVGLYVDRDSSWIEPVEVQWQRRVEDDMAMHTPSVVPPDALMLIGGVPQVVPGQVQTLERYTETLSASSPTLVFRLAGGEQTLRLETVDPAGCDAIVTLRSGATEQELFTPEDATFSCDEPHFEVHWAGDLDGDGRLDLLATFSLKYSHNPRRLYLSSAAAPGALVGEVSYYEP